ncbi:MAG TPA: DUF3089 domain-containing protein [Caulobacteraceae bacterium]|jgi:hypothetical protein
MARRRWRLWFGFSAFGFVLLALAAVYIWRADIFEALLDPQVPYTVYQPPPAPDYSRAGAWAQLPKRARPVAIFFVHPTTFDGGKDWNGPIDDPRPAGLYDQVVAPNYAAPFAAAGAVYAPRYRQASLYTSLSLFDDAIEAREFAYGDVARAFAYFLDHWAGDRPIVLVGVEQGGGLAARLLTEVVAPSPSLRRRLVAAYLVETAVRADDFGPSAAIPACQRREQSGCVAAWISARTTDLPRVISILGRSTVWNRQGRLVNIAHAPILCVNPLLGGRSDALAGERTNLGAANATGLEWGARPGFLTRQVSAQCVGGILRVSRPRSASLLPQGSWADRLRVPGYNLFWADLEADALARERAFGLSQPG